MGTRSQIAPKKLPRRPLKPPTVSNYFVADKPYLQFVSSGCTLLDCALGGGYVLGRITNIVGDKSTAKTALATEALTNFLIQYPKGLAAYRDAEAAFDQHYAEAMGLQIDRVDFGPEDKPLSTVEDFTTDLTKFLTKAAASGKGGIYVLDSLDSLSDEAEMDRDTGKASYGMAKAKLLSELFRKNARKLADARVLLLIISQVRDNIGAMFGDKHKRSGGRALDFYASQVLYLAPLGTLKSTKNKVQRPYGIEIRAKIRKNKVALPFREVDMEFHFGYGVEDIRACVNWLDEVDRLKDIHISKSDVKDYLKV